MVTVKETNIMYSWDKFKANILNCDVLFKLIHVCNLSWENASQDAKYTERDKEEGTMNSILAAVLDFADQDLLKERVENNIPEMH